MKFLLVLSILVFGQFTTADLEKSPVSPAISFESTAIDLGEIAQNIPVEVVFEFTNNGESALVISEVKPSCGCTVADYPEGALAPGESGQITAEYNAKSPGAFSKTLTVRSNADQDTRLILKGIVVQN